MGKMSASKRRVRPKRTKSQLRKAKILSRTMNRKVPKINHDYTAIRDSWDKKADIKRNYKNLGLVLNLNVQTKHQSVKQFEQSLKQQQQQQQQEEQIDNEQQTDSTTHTTSNSSNTSNSISKPLHPALQELVNTPALPKRIPKLNLTDMKRVEALVAKYKDNYKAMSRDIYINQDQLTPTQIKKLIDNYYTAKQYYDQKAEINKQLLEKRLQSKQAKQKRQQQDIDRQ